MVSWLQVTVAAEEARLQNPVLTNRTGRSELMSTNKNEHVANNKPERRKKKLIRLEVNPEQAISWSKTRIGGWATAQSPILVTTITLKRLMKRGYQSNLDLCFTLKFPHSLMKRCLRGQHEQWCERLSLPAMPAGLPTRLLGNCFY